MKTAILFAFAASALAQKPQFEVASIKASGPGRADYTVSIGIHIDGAQVSINYYALADYIRFAYDLKQYQVIAPEWMASTRFDVKARLPESAKGAEKVREMMKSLLEERFHLKAHNEQREFPVYALVVDKSGSKLTESPAEEGSADPPKSANIQAQGGPQGISLNYGNGSSFAFTDNKFEATKLEMSRVAELMSRFVDRPVVDMTNLKGKYDFELKLTEDDYRIMQIRSAVSAGVELPPQALHLLDLPSGDSLALALKALGLKLEPRKAPLPVLVVDSADKTPTEN
jgi:uncharacterized protein (TIGR03435 family)